MGMFDTIILDPKFDLGLTKSEQKKLDKVLNKQKWNREFQTKDLECWLNRYKLDKNNKLWEETGNKKGRKWKRHHHTGRVTFYTYINCDTTTYDIRLEYVATFYRGEMKDVVKYFDETDNTARISNIEKFEQLRKKHDLKRSSVLYKLTGIVYRRPLRYTLHKLSLLFRKLEHVCTTIRFKV
jgi:hypothetical protein